MTTVAANRTMMASDSLINDGNNLCDTHQKIWRIGDELIGLAGGLTHGLLFIDWYTRGRDSDNKPQLDDEFEALVLSKDGLFSYYNTLVPVEINASYWAIGSGAPIAMGAMFMGASPASAVQAACMFDLYTDTPVIEYDL